MSSSAPTSPENGVKRASLITFSAEQIFGQADSSSKTLLHTWPGDQRRRPSVEIQSAPVRSFRRRGTGAVGLVLGRKTESGALSRSTSEPRLSRHHSRQSFRRTSSSVSVASSPTAASGSPSLSRTSSSVSFATSPTAASGCPSVRKHSSNVSFAPSGDAMTDSHLDLTVKGKKAAVLKSRVSFRFVTPYAETYGMHPKFFEYNRKGEMQLNDAGIAEEMRQQEVVKTP